MVDAETNTGVCPTCEQGAHTVLPYGLNAVLVNFVNNAQARQFAARVQSSLPGVCESVHLGVQSVVLNRTRRGALQEVETFLAERDPEPGVGGETGKTVVVPVTYDGPDLAFVSEYTHLPVSEIVRRHTAASYTVSCLGFAPGFPYLSGLDPTLTVPRLDRPRTQVPAGSVGLAAGQTCIYPGVSPGGWQIIGHTNTVLFDATSSDPALLSPGDMVRFVQTNQA